MRIAKRSLKKQSQFAGAKMNVNINTTKDYGNKMAFGLRKNKPNSKPNKANFRRDDGFWCLLHKRLPYWDWE